MTRTKTRIATAAQEALPVEEKKGAVAVQTSTPPAPATTGPDALFAIIERAARDNTIDLGRMQELISMHKELKADNARAEYDAAMADAQAEMKTIKTNKANNQTHSKYASYEAMDRAIRPIYTKHGFAVTFNTGDAPKPDDVRVLCTISHRAGHRENYKLDVPADGKGAKGAEVMTRTHAAGSAISYGKRYLSSMVWNLSVGDDDDGNSAASIAERAKTMSDNGITHLNTANLDKAGLESYRAKNEKNIAWLKKNAPEEFERFQNVYSLAAERAGISKEEPKRGDSKKQQNTKTSPSQTSQSQKGGKDDGQPGAPVPGAGGDSQSEAAGKPGVTDVVDENEKKEPPEPIEFENYPTTRPFLDFSSKWLAEPNRTPEEARAWEAFYREKMLKLSSESKIAWVINGLADLMVQYNLIVGKAEREPGEEG